MAEETAAGPLPIVPFLKVPESGEPYLEGTRCTNCGAVYTDERIACSKCTARDNLETFALSKRGELYVYTIVYRSFPGVEVPYISVIVDLEGGGTMKGNLIGIDPDPEKIQVGMPVETVFRVAPTKDKAGNEYLMYCFQPAR